MSTYFFTLLCLIILPLESMRAPRSRAVKIPTLATRIQKQQKALTAKQFQLVHHWRQNPPKKLNSKQIDALAYVISKHHVVKDLQKHQQLLESSVINFALTPGFSKVLGKLFDQADKCAPYFRGTLFELEKALEIQRSGTGERVISFNQLVQANTQRGSLCREFDIITDRRYIECKAINWQILGVHAPQLEKQLLDQQAIIRALSILHNQKLALHLCSRELIPDGWRIWLDEKKISYSW